MSTFYLSLVFALWSVALFEEALHSSVLLHFRGRREDEAASSVYAHVFELSLLMRAGEPPEDMETDLLVLSGLSGVNLKG